MAGTTVGSLANASSAYTWQPDNHGGLNFFQGTTPITIQDYVSGVSARTGLPTSEVQNQINGQLATAAANYNPNTTNTTGGGGSSSSSSPAAASLYGTQATSFEDQLSNLDPALAQTMSDITSGYNTSVNAQNQSMENATEDYNTAKSNDQTNEQTAQQGIFTEGRQQTQGLQRLLGIAGSGNSSASTEAAPYLIGQETSTNAKNNLTSFGQQEQGLDTNFKRAQEANTTALNTLAQEEYAAQQSAKGSNETQRAGLDQSIISAIGNEGTAAGWGSAQTTAALQPFINDLNAANKAGAGDVGQYQAPVYQTAPVSFTPPPVASYAAGITPLATTPPPAPGSAGQNISVAPPPKQQPAISTLTSS